MRDMKDFDDSVEVVVVVLKLKVNNVHIFQIEYISDLFSPNQQHSFTTLM